MAPLETITIDEKPTLVFLPGIGANHRLFKHQTAVFPNSYAADWIDPLPAESLEQYAERFAEMIRSELKKRPPAPVIVCGLSLGGMIAPYVARHLGAAGCVLLCSIRGPKEFPRWGYLDWWFVRHCFPLRVARIFTCQLVLRFLLLLPGLRRRFIEFEVGKQMTEIPARRFNRPVGSDDKRSIQLGDFLDPLADFRVADESFFALIAADRIKSGRLALCQNSSGIADDEECSDRLSFAAFTADFQSEIDDQLERLQRYFGSQKL
jgi:pimeloyl-ACP methyl ester carboxylesterase